MKPKYSVPTMEEIANVPWNGFNVVSTFSGGGGSCLGYRMAGYKVLWSNEFVKEAQDTYNANKMPYTYLDTRDIRLVQPQDILSKINLNVGEIDIFDGSPPCSPFSISGRREEAWGKEENYQGSGNRQRSDDLFFEYIRLIDGLKPKVFIAENVPEMAKGKAKGYFIDIIKEMKKCGYNVSAQVLECPYLGIPQIRKRLIIIGVREDLKLDPVFPKPEKYFYTFRDVANISKNDISKDLKFGTKTRELWEYLVANDLQDFGIASEKLYNKNSMFQHRRLKYSEIPHTVVAASRCLYHPDEPRTLSISEIKAIQSFPQDYKLTGSFADQWERVGKAVPPFMMQKISTTILHNILQK